MFRFFFLSRFFLHSLCSALLSFRVLLHAHTHTFCVGLNVEYFSGHFQNVVSFMRTISFQQCGKYNKYWITKTEGRQNNSFWKSTHTHTLNTIQMPWWNSKRIVRSLDGRWKDLVQTHSRTSSIFFLKQYTRTHTHAMRSKPIKRMKCYMRSSRQWRF